MGHRAATLTKPSQHLLMEQYQTRTHQSTSTLPECMRGGFRPTKVRENAGQAYARQKRANQGVSGRSPRTLRLRTLGNIRNNSQAPSIPTLDNWSRLRHLQTKEMWNPLLRQRGMSDVNQSRYRSCACWIVGTKDHDNLQVKVSVNDGVARAYYSGLNSCRYGTCPRCGSRLRIGYSMINQKIFRGEVESGHRIIFVVLTIPHTRQTSIETAGEVLTKITDVAFHGYVRKKHSVLGYCRSPDHTFSLHNGHHAHTNYALVVPGWYSDSDVDGLKQDVYERMVRVCEKKGFGLPLKSLQSFKMVDNDDVEAVADYMAKRFDDDDSSEDTKKTKLQKMTDELSSNAKKAAPGHYTPMQLLDASAAGYQWARKAWKEYEAYMRGRRIMTWSKGLRQKYDDTKKTDEEILESVDEETVEDEVKLNIEDVAFGAIRRAGAEHKILRLTQDYVNIGRGLVCGLFRSIDMVINSMNKGKLCLLNGSKLIIKILSVYD